MAALGFSHRFVQVARLALVAPLLLAASGGFGLGGYHEVYTQPARTPLYEFPVGFGIFSGLRAWVVGGLLDLGLGSVWSCSRLMQDSRRLGGTLYNAGHACRVEMRIHKRMFAVQREVLGVCTRCAAM